MTTEQVPIFHPDLSDKVEFGSPEQAQEDALHGAAIGSDAQTAFEKHRNEQLLRSGAGKLFTGVGNFINESTGHLAGLVAGPKIVNSLATLNEANPKTAFAGQVIGQTPRYLGGPLGSVSGAAVRYGASAIQGMVDSVAEAESLNTHDIAESLVMGAATGARNQVAADIVGAGVGLIGRGIKTGTSKLIASMRQRLVKGEHLIKESVPASAISNTTPNINPTSKSPRPNGRLLGYASGFRDDLANLEAQHTVGQMPSSAGQRAASSIARVQGGVGLGAAEEAALSGARGGGSRAAEFLEGSDAARMGAAGGPKVGPGAVNAAGAAEEGLTGHGIPGDTAETIVTETPTFEREKVIETYKDLVKSRSFNTLAGVGFMMNPSHWPAIAGAWLTKTGINKVSNAMMANESGINHALASFAAKNGEKLVKTAAIITSGKMTKGTVKTPQVDDLNFKEETAVVTALATDPQAFADHFNQAYGEALAAHPALATKTAFTESRKWQAMYQALPKNPQQASGQTSEWVAPPSARRAYADTKFTLENPSEALQMITPQRAKLLAQVYPSLMAQMQQFALMQLNSPGAQKLTPYQANRMSLLAGVPLKTQNTPGFLARMAVSHDLAQTLVAQSPSSKQGQPGNKIKDKQLKAAGATSQQQSAVDLTGQTLEQ